MKKKLIVIGIGRLIEDKYKFRDWLLREGYEVDMERGKRSFYDGICIEDDYETWKKWKDLYDAYVIDMNT